MTLYLGENLISGTQTLVGESRNIGQIIPSTIPLTDAGLHLLDGALILGGGIYNAFVTYIAGLITDYPNLFCTEADWQSSVSTYGVCGKFVYDSVDNTVRLPKITGKLDGTTDVTALGDLVAQYIKLPNITGTVGYFMIGNQGQTGYQTGAFSSSYVTSNSGAHSYQDGRYSKHVVLDASISSSVYSGNGTNTKIHEQAINVFYYIVIATSTKTDIEVDIDAIATDLNGKMDRDGLNALGSVCVETYVNGASWYRVYSDGWCEQGGSVTTTSSINVQFLKTFANTNYEPILTVGEYSAVDVWGDKPTVITSSLTTSSMDIYLNPRSNAYPTRTVYWQVSGYLN